MATRKKRLKLKYNDIMVVLKYVNKFQRFEKNKKSKLTYLSLSKIQNTKRRK